MRRIRNGELNGTLGSISETGEPGQFWLGTECWRLIQTDACGKMPSNFLVRHPMRHHNLGLISLFLILFVAAPPIYAGTTEKLSCSSQLRVFNEGSLEGSFEAEASLVLEHGKPIEVELQSTTVVNATGTGYSCYALFKVSDKGGNWQYNGDRTNITASNEEFPDPTSLQITRSSLGYEIDTHGLSSDYCGARAQWPQKITVRTKGKKCITKYQ
jgi:hypothetical protein